ncbi:MAG: ATP-binding protein [Desulfobulbaceae bacterium]
MKPRQRLAKRILASMILVGLLPVILISIENYVSGKKAIEDSEYSHLGYALRSRLTFLEAWLHHTNKELRFAATNSCSLEKCPGEKDDQEQLNPTCKALQSIMRGHAVFQSLAVYDKNWSILVTTEETKNVPLLPPTEELKNIFARATGLTHGPVTFIDGIAIVPLCQPVFDQDGKILTYILGYLEIKQSLDRILGKSSDIGETGIFFLLDSDGTYLWTPDRHQHLIGTKAAIPEALYQETYKHVTHYQGLEGNRVMGITAPVDHDLPWVLLAQINESEAYQVLNRRVLIGVAAGLLMLALIALASLRLSQTLSRPLRELAQVAHRISSGNMQERAPQFSEKETHEVGVAFNTMLDRLAASQRALSRTATLVAIGELSSSIVHEMRNPLASMKINLQALTGKFKDDPIYSELLEITVQQAARLESMLTDLMKYGAPMELNLAATTFRELAGQVVQLLESDAANKKITIRIDDHLQDTPLMLDIELMTRALTNLVANAIQWAPEGGLVNFSGYPAPRESDWASIRVRDNGPGIEENQRTKMFKLFYSTRPGGNGIGLANVKKIIEYHGGFACGGNAWERGAVFSILLPMGGPER